MVTGLIKIALLGWSMLRLMFGQGRGWTRLMFEALGVLRLGKPVGLIVWSFRWPGARAADGRRAEDWGRPSSDLRVGPGRERMVAFCRFGQMWYFF